jgi:hypothetical protein
MSRDPGLWIAGIVIFVVGFIVVDLIVGNAIDDALQRAANQIGGPVPLVVAAVILVGTVGSIIAFIGGLRHRTGL